MTAAPHRSYYDVLGVSRDADGEVVKRAFRKLAMQYHPDRNPGDRGAEAKFKEVTEAYETLSDPDRRRAYDGPRASHSSATPKRRGANIHIVLNVSLREVLEGSDREVQYARPCTCGDCGGTGVLNDGGLTVCTACGGSGTATIGTGNCGICRGQGRLPRANGYCRTCHGTGNGQTVARAKVRVPRGVHSGQMVSLDGLGGLAPGGGPPGDLLVQFSIEKDARFTRKGADLLTQAEVPVMTMIGGGDIEIEGLTSRLRVTVPPETRQGVALRAEGQGLPDPSRGMGRGDLLIVLNPVLPTGLTPRQRELVREFVEIETGKGR